MKRPSRLIGREYGFLEVLSIQEAGIDGVRKAKCFCVCGKEVTRSVAFLRSKSVYIKSCRCSKIRESKEKAAININAVMQGFYLGKGQ